MEEHALDSWTQFEPLIQDIRQRYGSEAVIRADGTSYQSERQLLFRGQADSEWELETTLERKVLGQRFDVIRYAQTATSCVNEIESFTGKRWNTKDFPDLMKETKDIQDPMRVWLPCYEYLVYLRHHEFPSPLLDWTESAYIAAYFAFAYHDNIRSDRIAVYAFIERPHGGKTKLGGHAMITVMGPYITTHARHFSQKAWYTVATEWDCEKRTHYFCSHRSVLREENDEQDMLIKITIPANQRAMALRALNDYNINHFTLFQSEDSLVKAMAMKCFDMKAVQ